MKALTSSSLEKPLAWFEALVEYDGPELLHQEFKAYAQEQGGYFMPAHPYTGLNDESRYFIDVEVNNEMHMVGYAFEEYCKKRYLHEYGQAVLHLNKKEATIHDNKGKVAFLDSMRAIIKSLLEIVGKLNLGASADLMATIQNLWKYIDSKIVDNNLYQSHVLADSLDNTFGYLGNINTIKPLFDSLRDIGLFEDEDSQRELFFEVLTGHVEDEKAQIKFICTNQEAAYVLHKIKKLFIKLTPASVGASARFKNKQGKTLSQNDINKALNAFKSKGPIPAKDKIDKALEKFL